jgi:hypothetical protein
MDMMIKGTLHLMAVCMCISAVEGCSLDNTDYNVTIDLGIPCPILGFSKDVEGWETISYLNLSSTQIKLMRAGKDEDVSKIDLVEDTSSFIAREGGEVLLNEVIEISGNKGIKTTGSFGGSKGFMVVIPLVGRNNSLVVLSRDEQEFDSVMRTLSVKESTVLS